MRKLFLALSLLCIGNQAIAQNYIDLVKLSYNRTTLGNIDNEEDTEVGNTNLEVYVPIPLNAKAALLAGFTYENTRLGLQHSDFRTNLIMTRLNLGVKYTHGNDWSGTYMALPKLASDFEDLGSNDFQMGALALLEKKYTRRYTLKFGTYVSSENFGTTITPLIGLWYRSKNSKFTVNATLPIRADVNYSLTSHLSTGANLATSVKSYNLSGTNSLFYVQEESIRFSLFAAYGFLDDTLIVRAKVGLDTTDYGLYNEGDTVGAQVLIFQVRGDDRQRINSEFDSAPFFGIDLIFRAGL
jgi:hypothetical protein